MKKSFFSIVILVSFLFLPFSLSAKECEFEFYYQRIEGVEEINNPSPEGWWDKAKALGKKVVNGAKSLWETIRNNTIPGEGSRLWYSQEDSNIAYRINRTKVESEAHLLELMGVEDESQLTNGQKGLLEIYRHSQSQAIKDRMEYGFRSKVRVMLTDTTGFDDPEEFPLVTRDFWPCSTGFTISVNSKWLNYANCEDDARTLFSHEFAHTLDLTLAKIIRPYGRDKTHFVNEMTDKRTAFLEGFAIFNEMLDSEREARAVQNTVARVKVEDKKVAGKYVFYDAAGPELSGADLLNVEGINSVILYRMSQEFPDGVRKVFEAFKQSNYPWRNIRYVTRKLAKNHPEHAAQIAAIVDEATHGKLSDAELIECAGNSAPVMEYLENRSKAPAPEETPPPQEESSSQADDSDIKIQGKNLNPFVY